MKTMRMGKIPATLWLPLLLATLWLIHGLDLTSKALADTKAPESGQTSAKSVPILYKPPILGAPGGRIGGGTRSLGSKAPSVTVIAPSQAAFSATMSPVLLWYVSGPFEKQAVVTINDDNAGKTVYKARVNGPFSQGIFSFESQKLDLEKGKTYTWFVSLVDNEDSPSKNPFSGGQLVWEPDMQKGRLDTPFDKAVMFAENGYWYDAVWELWKTHIKSPEDPRARGMLADLLRQGELEQPAQWLLDSGN